MTSYNSLIKNLTSSVELFLSSPPIESRDECIRRTDETIKQLWDSIGVEGDSKQFSLQGQWERLKRRISLLSDMEKEMIDRRDLPEKDAIDILLYERDGKTSAHDSIKRTLAAIKSVWNSIKGSKETLSMADLMRAVAKPMKDEIALVERIAVASEDALASSFFDPKDRMLKAIHSLGESLRVGVYGNEITKEVLKSHVDADFVQTLLLLDAFRITLVRLRADDDPSTNVILLDENLLDELPWDICPETQNAIFERLQKLSIDDLIVLLEQKFIEKDEVVEWEDDQELLFKYVQQALDEHKRFTRFKNCVHTMIPLSLVVAETGSICLKESLHRLWWLELEPFIRGGLIGHMREGTVESASRAKWEINRLLAYCHTELKQAVPKEISFNLLKSIVDTTADPSLRRDLRILLLPELARIGDREERLFLAKDIEDMIDRMVLPELDPKKWIKLLGGLAHISGVRREGTQKPVFGTLLERDDLPPLNSIFMKLYLQAIQAAPVFISQAYFIKVLSELEHWNANQQYCSEVIGVIVEMGVKLSKKSLECRVWLQDFLIQLITQWEGRASNSQIEQAKIYLKNVQSYFRDNLNLLIDPHKKCRVLVLSAIASGIVGDISERRATITGYAKTALNRLEEPDEKFLLGLRTALFKGMQHAKTHPIQEGILDLMLLSIKKSRDEEVRIVYLKNLIKTLKECPSIIQSGCFDLLLVQIFSELKSDVESIDDLETRLQYYKDLASERVALGLSVSQLQEIADIHNEVFNRIERSGKRARFNNEQSAFP